MPKRADTLETTLLAVELLRRIPRGRKITAKELHAQLRDAGIERELRTIQRQLDTLCEHFAIDRDDRSKPYGYQWLENADSLSVPGLSPQESLLLGFAEEYLRNLLPVRLMKSMEGFFAQAKRNLGPDSNARLEKEWKTKVRVVATSQPLLPPLIKPGVFESVSEALYSNLWLNVNYRNAAGKESNAEVMPLGMVQQGPCLYLVCRFKGYDNERNLALHRIQSIQTSTLSFVRPKEFNLKKYDDDGRFAFGDGKKISITFCINQNSGVHLLESPLSHDQTVREISGGYEITATTVDSAILSRWLRGYGDSVWDIQKTALA